jgi:hypothetical protein
MSQNVPEEPENLRFKEPTRSQLRSTIFERAIAGDTTGPAQERSAGC